MRMSPYDGIGIHMERDRRVGLLSTLQHVPNTVEFSRWEIVSARQRSTIPDDSWQPSPRPFSRVRIESRPRDVFQDPLQLCVRQIPSTRSGELDELVGCSLCR
jgi:hypothetical protein